MNGLYTIITEQRIYDIGLVRPSENTGNRPLTRLAPNWGYRLLVVYRILGILLSGSSQSHRL